MSKLFSWFKKDKPQQDSASPSPEIETELQGLIEEISETEQAQDKVQTSNEGTAAQTAVSGAQALEDDVVTETIKGAQDENTSAEEASCERAPNVITQEAPQTEHGLVPEQVLQNEATAKIENIDKSPVAGDEINADPASELSLFTRLKASLARTKSTIGSGFSSLLTGKTIDDDLYEELETQLLLADVGMNTTNKIIDELTKNAKISQLKDGGALSEMLQSQMQTILDKVSVPLDLSLATDPQGNKHPFVILMVGVNGVGKTTTIGKLAKQFQAQGKSVMLAAGDTFRAAAVEQLQVWGERNNIPVVAQQTGADSASVIYDAIESAKAKNVDILIADTAGRLQNKAHLIEELKKVVRVMKKLNPQAPHEVMLTLDASTGQNAVSQTKIFNEAVGITGINLTKLDGTAKGGVIFALADQFAIPVRYIGIGEGIDDLRTFESKAFVEALFSE
ncbi:MAG: fused signal recognition particle receptor [Alphaproteobacteria bacterium]|jgi:fused signal recognition particle receptor